MICGYKCIPCSQHKSFEISFLFSTFSFSSNYLQIRSIFLIPHTHTKNKNKKKRSHRKWFFFFLFKIAGFCASLLPITCLFSSLWANVSGHSYPSITCTGSWCILWSGWCSAASALPVFGFWALRLGQTYTEILGLQSLQEGLLVSYFSCYRCFISKR